MKITLRQMAVFDAVARLGGVSQAAQEVALTQSAASMALRQLERSLGVTLFRRQHRKLTLNEHGRRLQPKIRSALLGASDVEAAAGAEEPQGTLQIGASLTIGNYVLPAVCADFMRDHPGVTVRLAILPSVQVIEQVESMIFDAGFVESPLLREKLTTLRWMEDELVIFCAAAHPLAAKKRVRLEEIAQEQWCMQPTYTDNRGILTRTILNHVDYIRIAFEASSVEAVKQAVKAGIGIGCQSRLCIQDELKDGSLKELPVADLVLKRPFNIITHKDIQQSRTHAAFIERAMALAGRNMGEALKTARKGRRKLTTGGKNA